MNPIHLLPQVPQELFALGLASAGCIVGAAIVTALRLNLSAAFRHFIWTVALLVPIAAPLVLGLGWRISLPVLPSRPPASIEPASGRAFSSHFSDEATASSPAIDGSHALGSAAPLTVSASNQESGFAINPWLAIWTLGCALGALRLLVGFSLLRRVLHRSCVPAQPWQERMLDDILESCGQADLRVRLAVSSTARIPFCTGLFRPWIVLPAEASHWSAEEVDLSLKHELAHLLRHDLITQFAARAACIVCWFNPLAWMALKRLRDEAEMAADDFVLNFNANPQRYASKLVALAEQNAAESFACPEFSFQMARSPRLKSRVLAILDPSISRKPPGRVACAAFLLLFTAALVAGVTVRCVAADAGDTAATGSSSDVSLQKPPYPQVTLAVKVVDDVGNPVVGALVDPASCFSANDSMLWVNPATGVALSHPDYLTDQNGMVTIPCPKYLSGFKTLAPVSAISLVIQKHGLGSAVTRFNPNSGSVVVTLRPGTAVTLQGRMPDGSMAEQIYAQEDGNLLPFPVLWQRSPGARQITSSDFPAGNHTIRAVALDASGALYFGDLIPFTASKGQPVLQLTSDLKRGRDVRLMLDPSVPRPVTHGLAIAFVEPVSRTSEGQDGERPNWTVHAVIAPDGSFTLPSLPEGAIHVTALCDGYVSQQKPASDPTVRLPFVFASSEVQPLVLPMEATGKVCVSARNPDGTPMVNANVVCGIAESLDYGSSGSLGQVRDSFQVMQVINGVAPAITEKPSAPCYRTVTDEQGIAWLMNVPVGQQHIAVTPVPAVGHPSPRFYDVSVEPQKTANLSIPGTTSKSEL